jgi:two-component system chemotaxis response regulator CheB
MPKEKGMEHRDLVVIGGSAGSLQVMQTILSALPWDFPAAVFLVLHTSEESPRVLPEILNRSSKLPVLYATHDAEILPSRVYVAPSGQRHMLIDRGKVRLEPGPRENRSRPAIDVLFRSASSAYGKQVVGVVLTGNLDDGTAGLLAIKQKGGTAIVQDPDEALAPSMPTSAMESTDVDFVLKGDQIGPKLIELSSTNEFQKNRGTIANVKKLRAIGLTYSCPGCGGVLKEVEEGGMMRFRCRVGHSYSPESLLADQTEAVERALWAAIRSMEEQAEFSDKLADNSRRKQRPRLARRFTEKADASRENAGVLRELLDKTSDEVFAVPLEDGNTDTDQKTGTD